MPLPAGSKLGAYEILGPIGQGGMGEVYRARDPRLDRDVAIKVLTDRLASDPVALARFEREATSVARLSHPNVLSIFEFGREAGSAFVVMELVDGETLRSRLRNGSLPPRRAVAYALQIAKGIAAAHLRGIVHRDLKPENVMIGNDDHVKILDFGLAKPIDTAGSEMTRAGLETSAGTVLGTFGYMAPEQVRGLAVDQRADMFAFGAVLYEMLSGQRAFTGETAADTMTAILTKEPADLDAARLAISPALDRIVRRCLEKSPDMRFQSANDLAFALETLTTTSSSPSTSSVMVASPDRAAATLAAPATARNVAILPWAIAAIAVAGAAAALWSRPLAAIPDRPWDSFTRVTDAAGEETSPTMSPDGTTVAYSMRVDDSWGIYAQRVGGRNATMIVNDPQREERGPAYSPDGSSIAFHDGNGQGGIFVAGATGESVRRLTQSGFDPAWSPDGTSIVYSTEEVHDPSGRTAESTLWVVDIGGGAPKKVADGDAIQPSWSPSGRRIAFWSNTAGQRDIYTIPATGGRRVAVTNDAAIDWCPVWAPDGRFLYFSSDRGGAMNLWRVAIDDATGRTLGSPEPVSVGVQATAALPSFSKDGRRLAFRSRVGSTNPVGIPFDPVTLRAGTPFLLDNRNNIRVPGDVSPDGKSIAYYSIGERQEDLFVGPTNGSMRRVTDDAARDRGAVFTRDGQSLVFYSNRDSTGWAIWEIGVDGGNLHKLASAASGLVYPVVSPKGDVVVATGGVGPTVYSISLTAAPGSAPAVLPGTQTPKGYFSPYSWSPDGLRLAGVIVSDSGRYAAVATYDLVTHQVKVIAPDEVGGVRWLSDSRHVLYFTRQGWQLVVVDATTGVRIPVDAHLTAPALDEAFGISPDGRTIYYGAVRAEADIWIMERH